MQAVQLTHSIKELIPSLPLDSWDRGIHIHHYWFTAKRNIPSQSSPFSCCEVFHRMKTKRTEVSNSPSHFIMSFGTQRMSTIGRYDDASKSPLNLILGLEFSFYFRSIDYFKNVVIIGNDSSQVNGYYHLSALSNHIRQLFIIHFYTIFLRIDHNQGCSHM